ncbi:MAG: TM2 domain-containing protein [Bacteroidetes bacterium]|jgi:TM2 domain-containing membrane protein YozV|nr:TM2 domain-containing protein [Bacteroidota bacterium]
MANIFELMPMLQGDELMYVQNVIKDMNDDQARLFANVYNVRRKDPQLVLLLSALGFIGIGGVQRFVLGQVGMGLLYLLTAGLCLIGTIVDMVNHKRLAFEYNVMVAAEVSKIVKQ